MKVSEVIKNITEIQDPDWISTLNESDLDLIKKQFWLITNYMKNIDDRDIIDQISDILNFSHVLQGVSKRDISKWNRTDINHFYTFCIQKIPRKKYSYSPPKRYKPKTQVDARFIQLLAKDLNESIYNCEEYYAIYEKHGIVEIERKKLFEKYGEPYRPTADDKIEMVGINSIKPNTTYPTIWEYDDSKLRSDIESFGLLEPILVDSKTNIIINGKRRYRCCKNLGWQTIQVIKRPISPYFIESTTKTTLDKLEEYNHLKNEISKLGNKEKKIVMDGLPMRKYLFNKTGISQSQLYKLEYIRDTDSSQFHFIENGDKTVSKVYLELKG
ncbi:hypothetical protein DHD32_22280 [Arenibacter sp. TNZ]|uniref:ParB/RepB/Spo0J family partition protein n=1 Tax=Arenibacter TaxID=178469 RepID=UPI000CD42B26|nr:MULTISPECIES: ParB N-terminal domain-containing protein [Arenibacter]MCM4174199.1 hypothetical protein [Arenibacter sp. TNZ]